MQCPSYFECVNKAWNIEPNILVTEYEFSLPTNVKTQVFGVDPGTTHIGLAYVWKNCGRAWEIKMPRLSSASERVQQMQTIMSAVLNYRDYSPIAVIEGASFADKYRQVELAEIRAAAILWFMSHGSTVSNILLFPPQTIRKRVFGSGKIKAHDIWKNVSADAAAALSCCFMIQ